jgi:hypothetical protein
LLHGSPRRCTCPSSGATAVQFTRRHHRQIIGVRYDVSCRASRPPSDAACSEPGAGRLKSGDPDTNAVGCCAPDEQGTSRTPSQRVTVMNTSQSQPHIVIDRFMNGHELRPGEKKEIDMLVDEIAAFRELGRPNRGFYPSAAATSSAFCRPAGPAVGRGPLTLVRTPVVRFLTRPPRGAQPRRRPSLGFSRRLRGPSQTRPPHGGNWHRCLGHIDCPQVRETQLLCPQSTEGDI